MSNFNRNSETEANNATSTQIVTSDVAEPSSPSEPLVLNLVASSTVNAEDETSPRPGVHWDEKVVDNEHLGKKKSKICCIFKKNRNFGESSSSEESSDEEQTYKGTPIGGPNSYEKAPNYHKKKNKKGSSQCSHSH